MKRYSTFLILIINLILCGVVSAQPTRRILDSGGVAVDFSTSDKQDTANSRLNDIKTAVEGATPAGTNIIGKSYVTDGTDDVEITSDGQLHVVLAGEVVASNSSIDTLGNGGVFTGTAMDTLNYGSVTVSAYSDQASTADGLRVESSSDGTSWSLCTAVSVLQSACTKFEASALSRYMRIIYTNGVTPQGVFMLQTVLKKQSVLPQSKRIADAVTDQTLTKVSKVIVAGKNPGGAYVNFQSTTAGNFKMSLEEIENTISTNGNSQLKVTNFDSSGNEGVAIIDAGDGSRVLEFDNVFRTFFVISGEHHEAHEGDAYKTEAVDTSMANAETLVLAFKTPDTTKWIHLITESFPKSASHTELIEGPIWSTGTGSQVTVFNRERNSANTTALLEDSTGSFIDTDSMVLNPSSLSGGTIIPNGGNYTWGTTPSSRGGQNRGAGETVLKQNTTYAVKCIADIGTNACQIKLRHYEHTNE